MDVRASLATLLLAAGTVIATPAPPKATATPAPDKKADALSADTLSGLEFRALGPALASGRIADLAIDPGNPKRFFVAVASGGVWKTENGGTTFTPVFDKEGSYSIGCVTLDPANPHTVWVGTGENNSQRSVAWGDGVYRSDDGGATWKNMGLKKSEHIGRILVDPRNSNVVYVAAQGPLWAPGGDRGLYKSTDGGTTWAAILAVSENTGISEVLADPRNPDHLLASAYQRRRHVWTLIDGGPESTIYKSTDAGKTWRKVTKGLPTVDLGRIGLAISPADPDVVYALVEAADGKGGMFRSTDRGESWEKRSSYASTSGQYYNELFCDPKDIDRLYSMDTWLQVSTDGGKTMRRVGEKTKHVDNHAMWIDPADPSHWLVGCDGGLYSTFDRGATWNFFANLPVTQFYRVAVDDSVPFYFIYGGTQDNNTLGGPSRTTSASGIHNTDWFITTGGDGFVSRIEPGNPNIVYSESQHAGLVRFDRATGEEIDIRPREGKGEEALRWNWDTPLIISPHQATRLYVAANRVFRSDDRGNSWRAVSPDLTRRLDRDQLKVMGRVWPPDAVAKNASTSLFGNIVALAESPLVEGLLYAGTDDGLVQVSEDGGATWRKVDSFPGIPAMTYVSRLEPSQHERNTVYAAFDNHKQGDFKPYLLRSTDRGRTWVSVAGNLPDGNVVYALAEDHIASRLLFAGTEFGCFVSVDGGREWIQLKGGLPTIAVRDLTIHTRESDLVLATFGRGFYVLDDISPLRAVSRAALETAALLFPPRDALAFIEKSPLGGRGQASLGDAFFVAPNPPFGAVLTYALKEDLKTAKERRQDAEKNALKAKGEMPPYPSIDVLRAEAVEEKPAVVVTITDATGATIRRLTGPVEKGFHRIAWDLRFPASVPARPETDKAERDPWDAPERGPLVVPGEYRATLAVRVDGEIKPLAPPVTFQVKPLGASTLPAPDRAEQLAFQRKTARLQRAVLAAKEVLSETRTRIARIKIALPDTPAAPASLDTEVRAIEARLRDLDIILSGDSEAAKRNMPVPPSLAERVENVVYAHWGSTSAATTTMKDAYTIAADAFAVFLPKLETLVMGDLARLEAALETAGAPHTPGRFPKWSKE